MEFIRATIILSVVLYFISFFFYLIEKYIPAYIFHGIAFTVNIVLVIVNWMHNGYVPFISMYQVLTFASACFTITYLYMHFVNKNKWMAKYFMICSGIVMIGAFFNCKDLTWYRPPALQSIWFIPHVLFYMIGYALCAVSFAICIIRCIIYIMRLINNKFQHQHYSLDKGIYDVVRIAFPFMTAGMFIGAIWANEIWGHYWSWDAKENWALITWLFYAIYLHCYKSQKLRKYMYIFIILGFIALAMTLFGINLFVANGEHVYS